MKNRRAKVVYSYVPQNDDELKLEVDEVIEVLDEIEEGWWKGISRSGTGVFPSNFVVIVSNDSSQPDKNELSSSDNDLSGDSVIDGSNHSNNTEAENKPKPAKGFGFGDIFAGGIKPKLSPIDNSFDKNKSLPKKPPPPTPALVEDSAPKLPPKPVREQAKVLFSYEAQNDDELTIKEGEIINIVSKEIEDIGWWKGELNGRTALFPDNFVELIKTTEETNSIQRVKKPERPTEKPPPPLNTNQFKSNAIKLDSTKSVNKSFDELPKTSISSNSSGVSNAPVIPGKKPKVLNSAILQQKPKSETTSTPITSIVRPDVVPQENGNKLDKDNESNIKLNTTTNISTTGNDNTENHFTSIDSTANKLIHLTAQRPKGPSSRRPPSTIFIPKESGNESKENGDISIIKSEVNANVITEQMKGSQPLQEKMDKLENRVQVEKNDKVEKLPPWMVELRKAQEKRKELPEDLPKDLNKVSSPIKSSPNRFSGDFGNKNAATVLTPTAEESEPTQTQNPLQLLKPMKLTKPNTNTSLLSGNNSSSVANNAIIIGESPIVSPVINSTNSISSKTTNVVINSTTTTTATTTTPVTNSISNIKISKVDETVGNSLDRKAKDFYELEKELRALKESTVSRKEFDELVKQVTELKEVLETQKLSYSKVIKDLINDVADERKKLATLQIEIDRLRKLTTTV